MSELDTLFRQCAQQDTLSVARWPDYLRIGFAESLQVHIQRSPVLAKPEKNPFLFLREQNYPVVRDYGYPAFYDCTSFKPMH